jgi:glycosyltransferase involved in cell wall biosynthesis
MADPLVILHTESSTGWGGQENRTLDESIGLRSLGARVIVPCQPGSRLGERAAEQAVAVRSIPMRNNLDWQAVRSILRVIREEDVNIVNTHSGRDSLLAGIASRLSRRRPIIVRTRHPALPITSRITYGLLPHKVVTVSGYVRSALAERGIAPERIVAIPTGLDVRGRFDPDAEAGRLKQELGLPADVPLVGTVAILRFKKGHHVLLEAIPHILRAVPNAVFVFAGDGPQHQNIANAIRDRGLEGAVRLLGLRRDILNVLKSIDVFVLPTLEEEALGTSCRYLCWPRGWFNDAAIRLAREEGYEACFSTIPGANGPRPDLGALRRIDVRRGGAAWLASVYLRLKGRGQHVPRQW